MSRHDSEGLEILEIWLVTIYEAATITSPRIIARTVIAAHTWYIVHMAVEMTISLSFCGLEKGNSFVVDTYNIQFPCLSFRRILYE